MTEKHDSRRRLALSVGLVLAAACVGVALAVWQFGVGGARVPAATASALRPSREAHIRRGFVHGERLRGRRIDAEVDAAATVRRGAPARKRREQAAAPAARRHRDRGRAAAGPSVSRARRAGRRHDRHVVHELRHKLRRADRALRQDRPARR